MRIRSQLLLAFLLLAVLPLTGIVGFSFVDAQRAIRRVAAAEAEQLSLDMEARLAAARDRFRSRVRDLPWERVLAMAEGGREGETEELRDLLAGELGEMAPALEALTFEPAAPPAPPQAPAQPAPGAEPPAAVAPVTATPEAPAVARRVSPSRRFEFLAGDPAGGAGPTDDVDRRPRVLVIETEDSAAESEISMDGFAARHFEVTDDVLVIPSFELDSEGPPSALRWVGPAPEDREAYRAWTEARRREAEKLRAQVEREFAKRRWAEEEQRARLVFGDQLGVEVREGDRVLGALRPKLNPERVLARIFSGTSLGEGEIPFAVDTEGRLYAPEESDRLQVQRLGAAEGAAGTSWRQGEWVVALSADESTGLRLGVARPMGKALRELRSTALRNLMVGLALIGLAVLGILPVSHRISAGVRQVAEGAERIARGDLETRLPVSGQGELAHLSRSFNSMVHDLRDHQERLLAEERRRRDEEVDRQLMQAELQRQGLELEEAREFQLSMLPRRLPDHRAFEVAVHVETATEVGGDYHDFHQVGDGRLTVVIGDAVGHGARAGTMVTVTKSLFSASSGRHQPAAFLTEANRTIRCMELGRMTMALAVLSVEGDRGSLSNAGMPPVLQHHAAGDKVSEILIPGMPLGGLADEYSQHTFKIASGDTLLLYSDGLPEQPGCDGEPVGYDHVASLFARLADRSARAITAGLAAAVQELTGGAAPADDITFVVVRIR